MRAMLVYIVCGIVDLIHVKLIYQILILILGGSYESADLEGWRFVCQRYMGCWTLAALSLTSLRVVKVDKNG